MAFSTVVTLAALFAGCDAVQPVQRSVPADAPANDGSLVKSFDYDRRLVVCNAYPSGSPMFVQVNSQDIDDGRSISFGECRNLQSKVQAGDRLDAILGDQELHSTFEIDTLPQTDAEMILVPHKRKDSAMIRFQSLAMPIRSDGKDAQVAVIDTFAGNTSFSQLRMEDHVFEVPTGKNGKVLMEDAQGRALKEPRLEEMSFDRVYSVEAGVYDAAIDRMYPKAVNLLQDQNYVFIRAGGGHSGAPESLVVYPQSPMPPPPAAPKSGCSVIGMHLMAMLAIVSAFLH